MRNGVWFSYNLSENYRRKYVNVWFRPMNSDDDVQFNILKSYFYMRMEISGISDCNHFKRNSVKRFGLLHFKWRLNWNIVKPFDAFVSINRRQRTVYFRTIISNRAHFAWKWLLTRLWISEGTKGKKISVICHQSNRRFNIINYAIIRSTLCRVTQFM